jgi:hypothetical protein
MIFFPSRSLQLRWAGAGLGRSVPALAFRDEFHAKPKLKSAQKLYEVLLFLRRQLCATNHVEEFHGVFQG